MIRFVRQNTAKLVVSPLPDLFPPEFDIDSTLLCFDALRALIRSIDALLPILHIATAVAIVPPSRTYFPFRLKTAQLAESLPWALLEYRDRPLTVARTHAVY